jgi:hypothetical protein
MLASLQAAIHEAMHLSSHVDPEQVGTKGRPPSGVGRETEKISTRLVQKDNPLAAISDQDRIRKVTKPGG